MKYRLLKESALKEMISEDNASYADQIKANTPKLYTSTSGHQYVVWPNGNWMNKGNYESCIKNGYAMTRDGGGGKEGIEECEVEWAEEWMATRDPEDEWAKEYMTNASFRQKHPEVQQEMQQADDSKRKSVESLADSLRKAVESSIENARKQAETDPTSAESTLRRLLSVFNPQGSANS